MLCVDIPYHMIVRSKLHHLVQLIIDKRENFLDLLIEHDLDFRAVSGVNNVFNRYC
jgi:hypothetical protein